MGLATWRRAQPPDNIGRSEPSAGALSVGRGRMLVVCGVLLFGFVLVGARLTEIMTTGDTTTLARADGGNALQSSTDRADIVDRNGVLMATTLDSVGLFANPRRISDPQGTALRLAAVLPELAVDEIAEKLSRDSSFVWLMRPLTPTQQAAVNRLGIPGLNFEPEKIRIYPQGRTAAHILGYTNIDGDGAAGIERSFDNTLKAGGKPLQLTVDVRIQHILREELARAMTQFSATGAAGVVMSARSGEILAMASLPDYDPHHPDQAPASRFNKATQGVYELGSTFKIFSIAAALEMGVADRDDRFDATAPLKVAGHAIRDYHARNSWLSLPEIFIYSSNIGAARIGALIGPEAQRAFLGSLNLLTPAKVELPEVGQPLYPQEWRPINAMTIAFGHGVSVSPLQLTAGAAAMVNGGLLYDPTLVMQGGQTHGRRVISAQTSDFLRKLMRLNNLEGSGMRADADGYLVGGKTGSAEKLGENGRYDRNSLISSYVGAFPMTAPRYVVHIVLDEPKGTRETHGYATGGWVAAPTAARVITRMAPLVGIAPVDARRPDILQALSLDPDRPTDGNGPLPVALAGNGL